MLSSTLPPDTRKPTVKSYAVAIGIIVIVVAILHGPSIRCGLLLDDYNHRAELREGDWSFRSLVDASHLGGHRRRVAMWWQDEADLYFFRPFAFLLMRAEYLLVGWRPAGMHGFSLGWTVLVAVLVMLLARRVLGSLAWACLAGVLFVMHPGNYLTGRWIACQNEQMATAFTLAALLFYARYSGWRWTTAPGSPSSTRAAYPEPGASARAAHRPVRTPRHRIPHLLAAMLCLIAALGCRESAIMLPVLLVLGDWIMRPEPMRQRWPVYATLGVILTAYLITRHVMLGGPNLPGAPYAYSIGTPGFTRFIVDKFVYYVLALFACFPVIGFEGLRTLRSEPVLFYGTFAAVVLLWTVLLVLFRRRRILGFWMPLTAVTLLPVLPVFASAHHLYLASVGAVIAVLAVGRWIMQWALDRRPLVRRTVRGSVVALIVLVLIAFTAASTAYDAAFAGFSAASQLPVDEVIEHAGPMDAGDRLFFINLPMLGFNCIPGIEEATGAAPLEGHVLTFAPALTTMERPSRVERVGERQLCVSIDGDGYFSGLTGEMMRAAIGRDQPFEAGESFRTPDFTVQIVRAGHTGIQELLFTFERPLDDPTCHLFLASPRFSAYPLRFGSWPASSRPATSTSPADTP